MVWSVLNMRLVPFIAWRTVCVFISIIIHHISRLAIFPSSPCRARSVSYDLAFVCFLLVCRHSLARHGINFRNLNNFVLVASAMTGIFNAHLGFFPASSCALLSGFIFLVAAAVFSLFAPNPWCTEM